MQINKSNVAVHIFQMTINASFDAACGNRRHFYFFVLLLHWSTAMTKTCRTFFALSVFGLSIAIGPTVAFSSQSFELHLQPAASTYLIEFTQGSDLSKIAAGYRAAGFESSAGKWISFNKWYHTRFVDTRLTWMTPMTPEFGWIWGMSTGERGEKYAIAPSFKLGFVYQIKVAPSAFFSVQATSVLGGRIKEKACTADYGDIGGVQQVNCRLAATELQPAETLKYLLNMLPRDRYSIFLGYIFFF